MKKARKVFLLAVAVNLFTAGWNLAAGDDVWVAVGLGSVTVIVAIQLHFERRYRRDMAAIKLAHDALDARAPEGVRVRRADGTEVPCELVYRGLNEEGIHMWQLAGTRGTMQLDHGAFRSDRDACRAGRRAPPSRSRLA
jgi:hypothetical protein